MSPTSAVKSRSPKINPEKVGSVSRIAHKLRLANSAVQMLVRRRNIANWPRRR